MALFYPTVYKNRITDITLQDLEQLGVRGLLLDVDNTLTSHGSQELSQQVQNWLVQMREAGIALTVVSNSWEWRVAPFAQKIGLRHISLACKPSPFGFLRGVHRLGLPKRACAVVGDQVFTDVLGANLCGITCFQLQPMAPETDKPFLRWRRRWERKLYARREEKGL